MLQKNAKTDGWQKRELSLYAHGWLDLIPAIVRQWNLDGKPSVNQETINAWLSIYGTLSSGGKDAN